MGYPFLPFLHQTSSRVRDVPALIIGDKRWTYLELEGLNHHLLHFLIKRGVAAGDTVAALLPNSLEYVCLIHALSTLGAVLVPLNTRLTPEEIVWQVAHVGASLLVIAPEMQDKTGGIDLPQMIIPPLEAQSGVGGVRYQPPELTDIQGILFTSGTSGQPKGVMLTYNNFLWSAMGSAYRIGTLPSDCWLCCLPLYHVGGLSIIFRCCLYGTTVVLHDGFDIDAIQRSFERDGITLISLVPTMLYRLIEAKIRFPSSLRLILLGGAAASPELVQKCRLLNLPIAPTYGLTEAASQVATMLPGEAYQKIGSVGKPLMFSHVRVLNEKGDLAEDGELGEIVVASPSVMQGYYNNSEETANAFTKLNELRTGDIGYLDEDNDLWIVQRRSDLIITGGENVYPSEVEKILRQHPAVAEACVVGVPNAEWGQQVAAAVVLKTDMHTDEADLISFCRQHLAGYKIPRRVRFVGALPQTSSGKIHRPAVLDLLR